MKNGIKLCDGLFRVERLDASSDKLNKQVWKAICKSSNKEVIEIYYKSLDKEVEILFEFLALLKGSLRECILNSIFLPDDVFFRKKGLSFIYEVADFGDLKSFIKKRKLTYLQKEDSARKLNRMLLNFYKLEYLRGDIKPSNIVVFKAKNKDFLDLRLIDLEHIHLFQKTDDIVAGTPAYKYSHKPLKLSSQCDELFSILATYYFIFSNGKRIIKKEAGEKIWESKRKNIEGLKSAKIEIDGLVKENLDKIEDTIFKKVLNIIFQELKKNFLDCNIVSVLERLDLILNSKLRPLYRLVIREVRYDYEASTCGR